MEISLQQYGRIQQYLDGEMLPDEEMLFINELKNNKLLREYLQFEQELRLNIDIINEPSLSDIDFHNESRFAEASHIKTLIERAGNEWLKENKIASPSVSASTETVKERKRIKTFSPLWLSIAAAACLILAVSGIVWLAGDKTPENTLSHNNKKTDSAALMQIDRQTENAPVQPIDSTIKPQPSKASVDYAGVFKKFYKKDDIPEHKLLLIEDALANYDNSNYQALQNMDMDNLPLSRGMEVDTNEMQNTKEIGYYYKGLSFIETRRYTRALSNLQWVIDSSQNKPLIAKAQWYQALLYTRKGNPDKALPLITSIANGKANPYTRQAKELLRILK